MLTQLPISMRTVGMRNKKIELEDKIKELEKAID